MNPEAALRLHAGPDGRRVKTAAGKPTEPSQTIVRLNRIVSSIKYVLGPLNAENGSSDQLPPVLVDHPTLHNINRVR